MEKMNLTTLVLGLILLCNGGYSQENNDTKTSSSSNKFFYGLDIGAAFSSFSHNQESFTTKKTGMVIRGNAEYRFIEYLGVSIAPGYIQTGALIVDPLFLYDDPFVYDPYPVVEVSSITSHNIQLPIIVSLRMPGEDCCVVPFLNLGAAAAYTIHVKSDNLVDFGMINGSNQFETLEEGITDKFKPWEYQAIVGTGLEFNYPFGNVVLNLQYCIGLSKINQYSYQNQLYDFSSNSWVFTLGYRFK